MALWLLWGSNQISHLPISIHSDSQTFSGYHLISHLTRQAETLIANSESTRIQKRITLRWIAAYENLKGNERADEEAKKAAAGS
ncbi:hypothetical protein BYT27DRAFT_7082368 [Phlegmacium glaucopus]|nr:hypothetical protein BYT27DRAFT_7082368 [Phlegmacium glaucopus]